MREDLSHLAPAPLESTVVSVWGQSKTACLERCVGNAVQT
jgi:hypothetical protein